MCWMAAGARACAGLKNEKQRQRVDFALSDFALNYLQPLLPGGASVDVVLQASGHAVFSARGLEDLRADIATGDGRWQLGGLPPIRSEEHTSELQSLMLISYAVFCSKKKNTTTKIAPRQ